MLILSKHEKILEEKIQPKKQDESIHTLKNKLKLNHFENGELKPAH
jgi:hypothetical protein